ncbi:ribosome silencing factor [Salinispira pacifica]|nr:ribosome silencing factor [Salinispira pacifica]
MSEQMNEQEIHREAVKNTARFMDEIKLEDVVTLDFQGKSSITDYYIIATVNSYGQLRGAVKRLHEYFYQQQIDCRGGKKQSEEDNWTLLDCDYFIIHLMTKEARAFYDLEKLWFEAERLETGA